MIAGSGWRLLIMDNEEISLTVATQLLSLDAKWLQPFDVEDPFNDNIRLKGFLCEKPDHRYGALAITHIGMYEVPQLILATPKLRYPFGKDGSFHFPPVKKIHIYEKVDGTNVFAYRYRDINGNQRLTYKLRLAPVLRNSRWGNFLDMWRELLQKHPMVSKLVERNNCNISFEMYGSRNMHLIIYDFDLTLSALFGVRNDATIVTLPELDLLGAPSVVKYGELTAGDDPIAKYAEIREEIEKKNRPSDDEKIVGAEGAVWYVEEPNGCISMWKCKPESVEAIHWSAGINKKAVIATCMNYLETGDNLCYESLLPLLLEEYEDDDIENFREYIDDCVKSVLEECEFKERVLSNYDELGMSIHTNKQEVMRAISQDFKRQEMKKVYSIIIWSR